jgi:hypothetical protein
MNSDAAAEPGQHKPAMGRQADDKVKNITLLIPVWGDRFVDRFLEFCLPTLLAPGNIPALARELPCQFVLLSSANDESLIRTHPAWQMLERICEADIQPIDDLITADNHTATITLAFERALRRAGESMRNSCFFFLMSDYLVADGSLRTALRTIQNGSRGVLVGNFQVALEEAVLSLRTAFDYDCCGFSLDPRELMQWALAHLHPVTTANIVNFGLSHHADTNRLFWRVDGTTLIGRFYLMHPIAIHPEVTNLVVGSSWDYSFIPELCPSGNFAVLTDSDDYLVVEMQPRGYDSDPLRLGPIDTGALASSLSYWTTAQHRANVGQTLVFHAAEQPANLSEMVAEADAFVHSLQARLATPPTSHRDHPYWVGSLAVHRRRSGRPLNKEDWKFLISRAAPTGLLRNAFRRMRAKLLGFLPDVTRLHPSWPDYKLPSKALHETLSSNGCALLVAQDTATFARWVTCTPGHVITIDSDHLLQLSAAGSASFVGTFDVCLLTITEHMLDYCDKLIDRVRPLLTDNGKIYVLVLNERPFLAANEFAHQFAYQTARLMRPSIWITDVHYVFCSRFRWSIRERANRLLPRPNSQDKSMKGRAGLGASLASAASAFVSAGPILLATYLANRAAKVSRTPPPQPGIFSSAFISLQASKVRIQDLPRSEAKKPTAVTDPS